MKHFKSVKIWKSVFHSLKKYKFVTMLYIYLLTDTFHKDTLFLNMDCLPHAKEGLLSSDFAYETLIFLYLALTERLIAKESAE